MRAMVGRGLAGLRRLVAGGAMVIALAPTRADAQSHGVRPVAFTALTAGLKFTCGLTADGRAFCWGYDESGQLGAGALDTRCDRSIYSRGPCARSPVEVKGGHRFVALHAGDQHACGIDDAGALWCWGEGAMHMLARDGATDEGCLHDGSRPGEDYTVPCSREPVRMPIDGRVVSVDGGEERTCAVDAAGNAWCWRHHFTRPMERVAMDWPIRGIAAGGDMTCVLTDERGVRCWYETELNDTGITAPTPDTGFVALDVGTAHACALDADGVATCWGRDRDGAVGAGHTGHDNFEPVPATPVPGEHRFTRLVAGPMRSCGIDTGGALWCWGRVPEAATKADDQCFDSNWVNHGNDCWTHPVPVHPGLRFTTVAIGGAHTCAVTTAHETLCWGENAAGQLGDGTLRETNAPSRVRIEGVSPTLARWLDVREAVGTFLSNGGLALVVVIALLASARARLARWGPPELGALAVGALVCYTIVVAGGRPLLGANATGFTASAKLQLLVLVGGLVLFRAALFLRGWWRTGPAVAAERAAAASREPPTRAPMGALLATPAPVDEGGTSGRGAGALAIVLGGWVLLALSMVSISHNTTAHDEVSGGLAVAGLLFVGLITVALSIIGGIVAGLRFRRHRDDRAARTALVLASLTVAAALLLVAYTMWPREY